MDELKNGRYYPDRSGTRKSNRKFYGNENPEDRRKYDQRKQENRQHVQANLGHLQAKSREPYPQTKDKVPVFVDPRNSKYYGYGTPLSVKTQYKKDKSKLHLMTLKDKKYLAATSWQLLCRQTAVI